MRDRAVATAKIAVLSASLRRGAGAVVGSAPRVLSADTEGALVRGRSGRSRDAFVMANIHAQKKRILRAERERLENRRYTSAIKTYFRRLRAAVESGRSEQVQAEHRTLVQTID